MKKTISLIVVSILALSLSASEVKKDETMTKAPYHNSQKENNRAYYYGLVQEVKHGGAYTYMKIKEKTQKSFWVVVSSADVKKGDYVRFKQQLVAKNFESKELNRKFDEIMFADSLEYKTK